MNCILQNIFCTAARYKEVVNSQVVTFHLLLFIYTWPEMLFSLKGEITYMHTRLLLWSTTWCKQFCLVLTDVTVCINFGNPQIIEFKI